MQELSLNNNQTMSSVELANLTDKRHDNVLRDIEHLLKALENQPSELRSGFKSTTYTANNGKKERCYVLDYEATMLLITGYSVAVRARVIHRWNALEKQLAFSSNSQSNLVFNKYQNLERELDALLSIANKLDIPQSSAIVEVCKKLDKDYGSNLSTLLPYSSISEKGSAYSDMLDIAELSKIMNCKQRTMNNDLAKLGYQVKVDGEWLPTELGKPYCVKSPILYHGKLKNKLRWNKNFILSLVGVAQ